MRRILLTLSLLFVAACGSDIGVTEAGYAACDGILNDDEASVDAPFDGDGDGYFDALNPDCVATYDPSALDCDDGDAEVNPGAREACDDVDNDCDVEVDEGADDAVTWYLDADRDSYGTDEDTVDACDQPQGYVADDGDCDDWVEITYPGADEHCDRDDNDCDGAVDEGEAVDAPTWYADYDGDGFGVDDETVIACEAPAGDAPAWVEETGDCDDDEVNAYPGAAEICDSVDNDCDDDIDEDAEGTGTFYADYDRDGYGDPDTSVIACEAPENHTSDSRDCDDTRSDIHPAADEICHDDTDNDCDDAVDEAGAVDAETWYLDDDGDGFGDEGDPGTPACDPPTDHVDDASDCDDGDDDTHPDADEVCGGDDEDCDGDVDESGAVDAGAWYPDLDDDDFGDAYGAATLACEAPADAVADHSDCDDDDEDIYPGGDEVCDDDDNDCDGDVDEDGAADTTRWYIDDDDDGFGDEGDPGVLACDAPPDHVSDRTDCDDGDDLINPDEDEVCDDGEDNNCDGDVDEDCAVDADYSGTWTLDTAPSYSCVWGIVSVNFHSVTITDAAPTIIASAVPSASQPGTMSGSYDSGSSTAWYVENVFPGGCTETYSIDAEFTDEDNFTGTFTAQFTGGSSCWDCSTRSWTISGSR